MEYVKRNEALGDWNFEGLAILNGNELMSKPEVVKISKEVIKGALRAIEIKVEKEDILGKGYHYIMGINISEFGDVSLHGERNSRVFFRCGSCDLGSSSESALKALAWAIYQLAVPKILKECKHIAEYGISVSSNSVFKNVGMTMEFILE